MMKFNSALFESAQILQMHGHEKNRLWNKTVRCLTRDKVKFSADESSGESKPPAGQN
jgi:hypothetical protein